MKRSDGINPPLEEHDDGKFLMTLLKNWLMKTLEKSNWEEGKAEIITSASFY